jgi:hypothetical protein
MFASNDMGGVERCRAGAAARPAWSAVSPITGTRYLTAPVGLAGRGDRPRHLLLTRPAAARCDLTPAPPLTRSCWRPTTGSCPWPSRWVCGCSTAHSVSDQGTPRLSCAISTRRGQLIANAPRTCQCTWAPWARASDGPRRPREMSPATSSPLNDPYHGSGTHLPDITVKSPRCSKTGQGHPVLRGVRGHHAEIGVSPRGPCLPAPGLTRKAAIELAAGGGGAAGQPPTELPLLGRVPSGTRAPTRRPAGADAANERAWPSWGSWCASSA